MKSVIGLGNTCRLEEMFEFWEFPGGEIGARLREVAEIPYTIRIDIENPTKIMRAILALDILKDKGLDVETLFIPYFPYARQDRATEDGAGLSVRTIAKLFDGRVKEIATIDPHSNVLAACFDKSVFSVRRDLLTLIINKVIKETNADCIILPDEGAAKRYKPFIGSMRTIVMCKVRDPATGNLSQFKILDDGAMGSTEQEFHTMLILDDICDGGGTFIGAAKVIKEKYKNATLNLYTTHGIYSKGMEELYRYFGNIYTTDSYTVKVKS